MVARRRAPDPLAGYRNRANALRGTAAEHAVAAELARYGGVVWMPGAENSARYKRDVWDLFDGLCLTATDLLAWQAKVTAHDPWPPAPIWRTRFMGLPKPPGVRFLLFWLTPAGAWRVWRLLPDGTRLEVPWPPEQENGKGR